MVDRVELGTATLSRVVELRVDQLPLALFPRVEVDGLTVLVDTGVGNDRDRAAMPPLDHLNTDFLDSLQRAGVAPESVDVVEHAARRRFLGADLPECALPHPGGRLFGSSTRTTWARDRRRGLKTKRRGRRAA